MSVAVYERNRARNDWLQGYRIHINPHGSRALHECLPRERWDAFIAAAGKPTAGFGFLTEQLRELLFLGRDLIAGDENDPVASHHSISRITLRQVLLGGMDDLIHTGKEFVKYERTPDGKVRAVFSDGTSATGDVLVAADGANSKVRQRYLPQAHRIDTGVVAIAGKLPLNEETRAWLPRRLYTSVNNVMAPKDCFLFVAVWEGIASGSRWQPPQASGATMRTPGCRPGCCSTTRRTTSSGRTQRRVAPIRPQTSKAVTAAPCSDSSSR